MTWLLKILGGSMLPWVISVIAGGVIVYYVNDYKAQVGKVAELKQAISQHQAQVRVLRLAVKQAKDETIASEKFQKAFRADVEKVCKVWNKAVADGDKDPIGSVLEELK